MQGESIISIKHGRLPYLGFSVFTPVWIPICLFPCSLFGSLALTMNQVCGRAKLVGGQPVCVLSIVQLFQGPHPVPKPCIDMGNHWIHDDAWHYGKSSIMVDICCSLLISIMRPRGGLA